MKVYRLRHNKYKGDVVFGISPTYKKDIGEIKVNEMFSNMKPWTHAIPYYKKSKFAFVSIDALITFLFLSRKLSSEEYSSICENFYIEEIEINTYSTGLSKFLCTYFDDEVEEGTLKIYDINDIKNHTAKYIYQDPVPKESIKHCKEFYYKKVKTYY